ncbi:NAD-dependent epimerase/dehydratase family protein [Altererythrobacter sp. H2]|uniref:polysaccharide biosynthesis C-terminal domain-containing protein n=1 Tax=Altererythrobacter sp. H2 TaxID=3108391 RepID=UPI002B4BB1D6|nr:NAD-dependent epimerase/dehydratase family protein [Altererythrobacter sp. H2]WRK95990.1 NAD-dependent epimerase/dehydratase family protein [Altererythrobacter sp. H2]
MKVVITGASGLLGHHAAVRLHAANCAARFNKLPEPYVLIPLDRAQFQNDAHLTSALASADAVLHFAGVNRASEAEVANANPAMATRLIETCEQVGVRPHIVYANSTHAANDTVYGNSKRIAGAILARGGGPFTDLVLPHIFGEGARPDYNTVTATFISRAIAGDPPAINSDGQVDLMHAGAAAQMAIDAIAEQKTGRLVPTGRPMSVSQLWSRILKFHNSYSGGLFPDLDDPFDLALFNSYRAALFPSCYPMQLKLNSDTRGTLFEAAKGGGGGQTFLSWTYPGITRGNHFHLDKVERFLVVEGDAIIRIRPVLGDCVWQCRVSGQLPVAIDMPTLHTHSIENVGDKELLTLFWTNAVFDPELPDTYADPVLGAI